MEPYKFRGGVFIGPWSEEQACSFIERVQQIAEEEAARRCPMAMRCLDGLPTCSSCKAAQS